MEKYNKPVFMCSHCKKLYKIRYWCERHEKGCSKNPNNKHKCYDCKHLIVDRLMKECEYSEVSEKTFYCSKKDVYMYTCVAERMDILRTLDYPESRMPIECDKHEYDLNL